jgi:hypothetical protein
MGGAQGGGARPTPPTASVPAWKKVMRLLDLGGLRIINLEVMAWAQQARWQWHKKTRVDRPWTD